MGDNNVLLKVRDDDFVEYFLFPVLNTNENEEEKALKRVNGTVNGTVQKYTGQYLWHKDDFRLRIRTSVNNILSSLNNETGIDFYISLFLNSLYRVLKNKFTKLES